MSITILEQFLTGYNSEIFPAHLMYEIHQVDEIKYFNSSNHPAPKFGSTLFCLVRKKLLFDNFVFQLGAAVTVL